MKTVVTALIAAALGASWPSHAQDTTYMVKLLTPENAAGFSW